MDTLYYMSIHHITAQEVTMMMSLVSTILLSVGLVLDFLFGHKLVREPVTVNPVTLIFKVLKYAAKHRHPVMRSAFTYCDDEKPSRLDYGKTKYGGPFTTEQVEDVKTFWRILLVISVISLLYFPLAVNSRATYNLLLPDPDYVMYSIHTSTTVYSFIIYCIPAYELLVYPCLRHRGPSILLSVGFGAGALILSSLYGLTAETVQYFTTCETFNCSGNIYLTTSIPVNLLMGIAATVLIKSSFQFVCAQGPYMRGLLVGFTLSNILMFVGAGRLFYLVWNEKIIELDEGRERIWFFLTTLVLGVVSSVLLVCVIRWYKARERDEIVNYQASGGGNSLQIPATRSTPTTTMTRQLHT